MKRYAEEIKPQVWIIVLAIENVSNLRRPFCV